MAHSSPVCVVAELEFGVDETGRAVSSTGRVLNTNSAGFGEASLRGLRYWQYAPAMKGGVAVRQVVRQRIAEQNNRLPFTTPESRSATAPPATEPCK